MPLFLQSLLVSEFNELSRDQPQPKHGAWRKLEPPVTVRGYFANQWHDVVAVDINDDTRELRVELPPKIDSNGIDLISHKILPAGLYEAPSGAL